ncbi:uncharacterized protein BCR38DRAFT_380958 [Pseudomassariella vexata]|uniref:DUF7732 domain-containing protein n=1 Tax=Pseudomassariella vexata TaxID=1141098 RepID=A0A1Y2D5Q1_9PEZI|nr:uncharacterized protein BCR38DRAFT_380958 [Pseudomassariella vexata]ORY54580.1 hypothetical protein BCR38DRAFT_380958 [Pseudomassariella vexata]
MKFLNTFVVATAFTQGISAVAVHSTNDVALNERTSQNPYFDPRAAFEDLWKRKGGGGSGGRGGGSSSSGSSSGSSSSGGRGTTTSTGSGRGQSLSNGGGSTTTGSGPKPQFGSYYGGGARTPYRSGTRSPSGIVPAVLVGGALGFWGAYWLAGAYSYPYTHHYYWHNSTTNQNETKPINCVCEKTQECGCDDNGEQQTVITGLVGNGTYNALNQSLITAANVNGTDQLFINGTLPNGTTAAGGSEDPYSAGNLLQPIGWVPVITTIFAMMYIL